MDNGRDAWETNAVFWDSCMGDESNPFHREVVRPRVSELLEPQPGELILDIACGNGNYSAYLAQRGIQVVAVDYSRSMISLAEKRQARWRDRIQFLVCDVTQTSELLKLRRARAYDKAVSNMAIMDISDITALFDALKELLIPGGIFVFATQHPCFVTRTEQYLTPHSYPGIAIEGQPVPHRYYHRSLQDILQTGLSRGFVLDGFYEEAYGENETPAIIVVRLRLK